jgi:nitrile hydratase
VVTAHHGATLFPDAHAVGRRTRPVHLYTVAFEASDLWGDRAEAGTEVRIDLYEPYLEAV